jgi:predicted MFS family arabinose efflux permease
VSGLGISISAFAYPLVVLAATGSAAKAGLVGSVLAATTFVLRLPAGVLVDRWRRKRIMIAADLGRAAASASLAVALALGHFYLAHVLAVAVVEGSLGVLFGPAESAAVRRVVAPEQRRDAVARNQSRWQIANLLGPSLAGAFLGISRALPFVADAISYLVSLGCVLSVKSPLDDPRDETPRRLVAEVFDGIRWLWTQPFLRALLGWLALGGIPFAGLGLVILVLARDRGASPAALGVMWSMTAAGGVIGAFATPWLLRNVRPRLLVVTAAWVLAVAVGLLYVTHSPYLIGALGGSTLLLTPAINALLFSSIAVGAPDRLQGRATSAAIQLTSLTAPLGPLVAGLVLGAVGPPHAVLVYAAAIGVLAAVATALPGLARPPV